MKKCPQCGRAYSDFVQQCPTCKIALAKQQTMPKDPAAELGGGAGSTTVNGAGQAFVQPSIQPPARQSGSGTYPGEGTQGGISQNNVQNIPVTYANRHQFQPTPEEELVISAHGGDCGIKQYVGNRAMVVIPAKIRGHRVVKIENQAFGGMIPTSRPQTVIIPETVLEIGGGAFWRCRRLETVIAHPDIYLLGPQVFAECPRLKTVDFGVMQNRSGVLYIPPNMKTIGAYAFSTDSWRNQTPFQEVWLSRKTKVQSSLGAGRTFNNRNCAIYYYEDDHS